MRKSKTIEYAAWNNMKSTCKKQYGNLDYICDRWKNSFDSFLEDMGEKPAPNYRLVRLNESKFYYDDNCAWVSNSEKTFLSHLNGDDAHNLVALQKKAMEIIVNSAPGRYDDVKKILVEVVKNETYKKIQAQKNKRKEIRSKK